MSEQPGKTEQRLQPSSMQSAQIRRMARGIGASLIALLIVVLFLDAGTKQLKYVNLLTDGDQQAYLGNSREMFESNFTKFVGRARMPVYHVLLALAYRPGMTEAEYFVAGKYFDLYLSLGLVALLGLMLFRSFGKLQAFVLLLIFTFTVYAFKASYTLVEPLFYFLNLCLFLLMLQLIQRPTWRIAAVTGIVAGLTHLTKAAILPGLILCLVTLGVKGASLAYQNRRAKAGILQGGQAGRYLLAAVLAGLFFLVTVFPYIRNSKRVYGAYFYNVTTTFYTWYDTWDEVEQGTRAHGDKAHWPDMPADQIPSLSRYVRQHTPAQILGRFTNGINTTIQNAVHSYGFHRYFVLYLGLFVLSLIYTRRRQHEFQKFDPFRLAFLAIYFAAYFVASAWFIQTGGGVRLVLGLFMPAMWVLAEGLQQMLAGDSIRLGRRSLPTLDVIHAVVLVMVCIDIYFILTDRILRIWAGD